MSLVSSRVGLRHRCTIERDGASAGAWGLPDTPEWAEHLADVPCRVVIDAGREPVDSDRTVVLVDMRLLVPLGTDVTERDRISEIVERGEAYTGGPFQVEAVLRRRTHLELSLRVVS